MDGVLGTVLILVLTGFIADINSGAIVGSVFSARSGFRPGFAFLGGATAVRLVQGLLGLGVLYSLADTLLGWVKIDSTTFMLISLAGLAILLAGVREVIGKGESSDADKLKDPENAGMITGRTAFLTGLGINIISLRQWIFTSVAVSTIGGARLEWPVSLLLFVAYLALSSWLIVGLLLLKVVRPNAAPDVMDRIAAWTDKHLGSILAWAAIVLGVLILGFGLYGWLA